jgi:hypothetical protein
VRKVGLIRRAPYTYNNDEAILSIADSRDIASRHIPGAQSESGSKEKSKKIQKLNPDLSLGLSRLDRII